MTKNEQESLYQELKKESKRIRAWAEKAGALEVEEQLSRGTSLIVGPRTDEEFKAQMAELKKRKAKKTRTKIIKKK